jgi:hypothetical protein
MKVERYTGGEEKFVNAVHATGLHIQAGSDSEDHDVPPDVVTLAMETDRLPGPLFWRLDSKEDFLQALAALQDCAAACGWCEKPAVQP